MQPVVIVGGDSGAWLLPERPKRRRSRLCSWIASIINYIGRRPTGSRLLHCHRLIIARPMGWSFMNGW